MLSDRSRRSVLATAALFIAVTLLACGSGDSSVTGPTGAGLHAVVSPDSTASVDARVAKAPGVVLLDASSKGRSGVRVTFRIVSGGGQITDSVVTTDASGRATLGSWTIGPTPVSNVVEATAEGEASVRFTVDARWPRRIATSALGACTIIGPKVFCWGDNSHFEFGTNSAPTSSATPIASLLSTPIFITELSGSYGNHFCGITTDRAGLCWGRNDFLQIGSPIARLTGSLVLLQSRIWKQFSVGRITTCAIEETGLSLCWGANQRGEIGNPAATPTITAGVSAPTLVIANGVRFKQIAAGWQHACGISVDGIVHCWGTNLDGQLGIAARDSIHPTPTPIASTERFASIAAGGRHTCALTTDNRAFCWGQNSYGQLGDGSRTSTATPTAVAGGLRFTSIATGTFFVSARPPELATAPLAGNAAHTCALTETGKLYCWGWNGWGQLGDGTFDDRLIPTAVSGGLTLNGVALGESSSCGMRGTSVWCWGGNTLGQLGDGTTTRRPVPARVLLP